jgi:sugar O-acyltransferase (sialic acid O-acetyltransferase NeuD family)
MKDIAIYGAGGMGREIALLVSQINDHKKQWNVIGYYDDAKPVNDVIDGLSVLGGIRQVNARNTTIDLVIAIADPAIRRSIVSKISNTKVSYPIIVHPHSNIGSSTNQFGRGTIITAGCILTTGIHVGEFVLINLLTTVGHDVQIGNYTAIMPGCNISGHVTLGEGTMVGTGVKILQNLSIGKNCVVGAGAVVTKSAEDGATLIGIPARQRNE